MTEDIRPLLESWPYDPHEELMVRKVVGHNGQPRLQLRLELGLIEMQLTGRPDGRRPHGFDSLLDYHLDRAKREALEGAEEPFKLDHDECDALQRESLQFYHRRISYLKLGDYAAAAEDSEHNLATLDFLRERAADSTDWLESERYRPFVLSHLARARALAHVEAGDQDAALRALDDGIETLETLFRDDYQRPDLVDESQELQALVDLRASISLDPHAVNGIRRESETERLQRELAMAIDREEYEQAAVLRDTLDRVRRSRAAE